MKKNLTLLAVLAGVVAIIIAINTLSQRKEAPSLFKGFQKASVIRLVISQHGAREELVKENGAWFATANGRYPADTVKINEMLTLLSEQKKGNAVAKNPARFGEMRVDTAAGIRVAVEGGGVRFNFIIGGTAQGYTGSYVRLDGQNEVYVSKGVLDNAFTTRANGYRNKAVLSLNKDNVSDLAVQYRGEGKDSVKMLEFSAHFLNDKSAWKIDKPMTADGNSAKLNEYLARFCGLEADDWYDKDTTSPGFDKPFLMATLKKGDGSSVTLIAGNEQNGNRFVRIEGDDHKYLVGKGRLDPLKPNLAELTAPPPSAAAAPAAAKPAELMPTMPSGN
ncbi:MAG: DUF4340 domain-containing protein [Fibrobacterota bacterium]